MNNWHVALRVIIPWEKTDGLSLDFKGGEVKEREI